MITYHIKFRSKAGNVHEVSHVTLSSAEEGWSIVDDLTSDYSLTLGQYELYERTTVDELLDRKWWDEEAGRDHCD